MNLCAILLLLAFTTPGWGKEPEAFPDLNLADGQALKEASRVLEEEVKLAARSQTYVLIDLATKIIHIKGRGMDLHQIPIISWASNSHDHLKGIHKLTMRPAVVRRKIEPGAATEQEPIAVDDMPVDYVLTFTPALTITVVPSASADSLLKGVVFLGKAWWRQTRSLAGTLFSDQSSKQGGQLQLTVSGDHAQSLAWSLVDGMAVVIRRASNP
ncbi:MAG TPA: hypothetical protein PKD12_04915 [Nitrospira sp.]|nr:hypothetical protein [Nitrospira sp.]